METLPAGQYYIGDCCYVLQREHYDWDDFCHQFWEDGENITINKLPVVAYSTLWGDGTYKSNTGKYFPVDAGMIGIMPKKLWKGTGQPFGCTLVTFKAKFTCEDMGQGVLRFGDIVIDTGDEDEDEEDEYE